MSKIVYQKRCECAHATFKIVDVGGVFKVILVYDDRAVGWHIATNLKSVDDAYKKLERHFDVVAKFHAETTDAANG